jgi:hypothetical protein
MKAVWIASIAVAATTSALAQTTIYKHIDDSGRVTYSNKPMKGATVLDSIRSHHPATRVGASALPAPRRRSPWTSPMRPSPRSRP